MSNQDKYFVIHNEQLPSGLWGKTYEGPYDAEEVANQERQKYQTGYVVKGMASAVAEVGLPPMLPEEEYEKREREVVNAVTFRGVDLGTARMEVQRWDLNIASTNEAIQGIVREYSSNRR